jgi:hypothetical protein
MSSSTLSARISVYFDGVGAQAVSPILRSGQAGQQTHDG